ncbi:hypothetical protein [Texcoconibacillus texcoconensis]|uniref:Intracellular proteinase inhibitor BsuPI domain-containing protein n=1 Tax=Texcoconibacillus texcoconensis TaxID=1095777 RepID=A0A840QP94_9BACI|nr:hypothetical protein [Texcoconibacillus texcoconensis]MBB5173147.1 hypothetical protein [Texcoconibacillus texcoconensis]
MKKLFALLIIVLCLAFVTVACGGNDPVDEENGDDQMEETTTEEETDELTSEYPFPDDADETGEGEVTVDETSGDPEDIPVKFVSSDTMLTQIGYTIENFDADKEVFIYVNEIFVEARQGAELAQSSLNLEGWLLEPGEYEVVAAQFEDNDPDNDVLHLSKSRYKIEEGS